MLKDQTSTGTEGYNNEKRSAFTPFIKANGNGNHNGSGHVEGLPKASAVSELSENARVILEKRYLRKDDDGKPIETPEDLFRRVARSVALGETDQKLREAYEERFYDLMSSLKFMPNSPTLVNAGTAGAACPPASS